MPATLNTTSPDFSTRFAELLAQKRETAADVSAAVAAIVADVQSRGDQALFDLTKRFDRFELGAANLRVSPAEIAAAKAAVAPATVEALKLAATRIEAFHARHKPSDDSFTDALGVTLGARWTPVDLYCGGIEHAILHLLYARFFTKVIRDLGLIEHGEPFLRLRNQGMILAEEGTKMSKSRGTQIAPDEIVAAHGADALRLHLMYLGPWEQGGPWNSRGIAGMERFIRRAFALVTEAEGGRREAEERDGKPATEVETAALRRLRAKTVQRVTTDLDEFQFNTMVAGLIEYVNELMKLRETPVVSTPEWREALETLVLLMAPSTPHVAEELWERLGMPYSVHHQSWPNYDPALTRADEIEVVVQVNGKVRDRLLLPVDLGEDEARALVMALPKIVEALNGREPKKVVYVPGRLVSVVV